MNDYTFRGSCDGCGQKPVLKEVGMCAVCTWGEADALWEWTQDKYFGWELREAQKHIKQLQRELEGTGMSFAPEIARNMGRITSLKYSSPSKKQAKESKSN